MRTVKFDGEEGSTELYRITAKKNFASSMQSHKMGATFAFDAIRKALLDKYPDLANEVNGPTAVKQLPTYAFVETPDESGSGYNKSYAGNFTVGADKGDKGYFGFNNADVADVAIRLEGTDHQIGTGFNYPWEVGGVANIRYSADKEALCIVTGEDEALWSDILEQSACGVASTADEIEAYLIQEFKPAYDCAYRANPLLAGTTMTLGEINADLETFRNMRRREDDRKFDTCEIWIDGDYSLYYLNRERNQYEPTGVNLYSELSAEERALVDSATTVEEKNAIFINFRLNRFATEAPAYWSLDDAIYQYAFLYIFVASDNFEKNMYPYKMKLLQDGSRWRFLQDDLDSILPTDNQAQDTKPYSAEVEDFTDDSHQAYIFKGEDNALFQALRLSYPTRIQRMCRDILQAMYELSPYGTTTLEKLMGFFDYYFFDRAQHYFTKSAYNNDAEYSYEAAWNNDEYMASGVDIKPLAQSLGDHYLAERQFIEKRLVYLMSKCGFGSFADYSDSSLGLISFRTQVAQGFTVTPAIDLFPTILGGQSQTSRADSRVKAGESVTLAPVGGGNANTYITGADWLRDIGDLKNLQVDTSMLLALNVSSKRLQRLKIGDEVAEDVTSQLEGLNVQSCPSLTSVDARNLSSLTGIVDLSRCPRLREALFGGTNVSNVIIASGSKIDHLQLPDSVAVLDLRNTKFLSNFELSSLANVGFLRLENNAHINGFDTLKTAYGDGSNSLLNIRIVGFSNDGTATDVAMLASLADGNHFGIDNEGNPTTSNPVIEGTLRVTDAVNGDTYNAIVAAYPSLTLDATNIVFYIEFADPEVLRVLLANGVGDGAGITEEQAAAVTTLNNIFKGNTTITEFDELENFTGVTAIGTSKTISAYGDFRGCTSLQHLVLPHSVTTLNPGAFYGCTSLVSVGSLENITTIGSESFYGCTSLEIPDLTLPNLTSVGQKSFYETKIASFKADILTTIPTQADGIGVFQGCAYLTQIYLPSITSIGSSAFKNCSISGELELNATTIGDSAFYSNQIEKLILPNIDSINGSSYNAGAFANNTLLHTVDIGSNCTNIGRCDFALCTALSAFICKAETPPTLHGAAFDSSNSTFIIYVPDASVDAYRNATNWSTYASGIFPMSQYNPDAVLTWVDITSLMTDDAAYSTALSVGSTFTYSLVDSQYTSGYKTIIYELGDYLFVRLTGKGGKAPRLYCFIDSNDVVLSVAADQQSATDLIIRKPYGATKVIVSFQPSYECKLEVGKYE